MTTRFKETVQQHRSNVQRSSSPPVSAALQTTSAASAPGPLGVQAAVMDSQHASPAHLLEVQRRYGNRAVQRMLSGSARASEQQFHKQDLPLVSRASLPGSLQGGVLDSQSQTQIERARGSGSPLDASVSAQVGGAIGADFSGVKVHTDRKADELNRSLSAKAFTTGGDIFFSKGAYQPGSSSGKHLLAHELTHVVQQSRSGYSVGSRTPPGGSQQGNANLDRVQTKHMAAKSSVARHAVMPHKTQTRLMVGPAGDQFEHEANRVSTQVMRALNSPQPPAAPPIPAATQAERRLQTQGDTTWNRQVSNVAQRHDSTPWPKALKTGAEKFGHVSLHNNSAVINRKTVDLSVPRHAGKGVVFKSNLKKINILVNEYNTSDASDDSVKQLEKHQNMLRKILGLIEDWHDEHARDEQQPGSQKEKQDDLEKLYNEAELELIEVNQQHVSEQGRIANSKGDDSFKPKAGASFLSNWDAARGDVIYGFATPRQNYITEARKNSPAGYWYTMDDYNNFYGIGTGDAFRGLGAQPDVGAKKKQMGAHMDKQKSEAAPPSATRTKDAYYQQIIKSKNFNPQDVLDLPRERLTEDAANWSDVGAQGAGGRRATISLQHVRAVRRACKGGIALVTKTIQGVVHFVLDGTGDLNLAAKKISVKGSYIPITHSELRYVYRNWPTLKGKVKFYVNKHEVPAPWEGQGRINAANKDTQVNTGKLAWKAYGKARERRYKFT